MARGERSPRSSSQRPLRLVATAALLSAAVADCNQHCNDVPENGKRGDCTLSSVGVTHKCYPVCNPGFEPVNGDGELRRFVRECMPSGVCEDHNHVTCQKVVPADCPKSFRLPADVMCQSVTFAGGVSKPTTDAAAEHQLWAEGMQLYANWTNDRGGLRLGPSEVGFVNVSLDNPFGDENGRWVELYVGLLRDRDVHVLLAPIQTDKAVHVIKALQEKVIEDGLAPKPILVTSSVPAMFTAGYEYVWAVDGPRSRMEAARGIVSMLGEAKAETFTIVGESTPFGQNTADNMTDEVKQTCSTCAVKLKRMAEAKPGDPFAIHEVSEAFEEAQEEKPDAFVAIGGHTNGFTAALDSFQENRYVPSAAVYVGGLATTKPMREKQKQQKASCGGDSQKHCFVFDQWIGTVSWTADMENRGPDQWLRSVPDRYKNRHVIVDGQNRSRYIGSASDFKLTSASYLDGSEPTQYHASAAATLLMFQLAVELAGNGTGLTGLDLRNATALSAAVKALDAQSTFFGPIKLNDEGWNPMFTFGIGQFQGYENAPRLIGPAELKPKHSLVYPAEWPCDLLESSDHRRYVVRANGKRCEPWIHEYNRWEVWAGLAIGLPLLIALCGAGYCYKKGLCCRREEEKPLLQRRSFFEDSGKLPGVVLAERDVATRWTTAQMAADTPELRRSFSSSMSAVNRNTAPSVEAMAGRQLRRDVLSPNQGQVKVFFSDEHVRELKPEKSVGDRHGWKDPSRAIGRGAYGTVYKATWRGNDIAVKVLALPDVPRSVDQDAKTALQEKLAEIILDYTKEVEICCDLAHPNLVTMLGFATKPELLLMQELMEGSSIDQLLYTEKWKPTTTQILKVALDVASGMDYLHRAFQETRGKTGSGKQNLIDKPIIHRDLKSPNLLLQNPPPKKGKEGDGKDLCCKISDFGLSRDKNVGESTMAATEMMTGCGSILWMAPEILLGEKYNEKVDVFSYAMCLLELTNRNLPWHGSGVGQQAIPVKITKGKRPDAQIRKCEPPELKKLIEDCWQHEAYHRPEFNVVMEKLERIYIAVLTETGSTRASRTSKSRRSSGSSGGKSSRSSGGGGRTSATTNPSRASRASTSRPASPPRRIPEGHE